MSKKKEGDTSRRNWVTRSTAETIKKSDSDWTSRSVKTRGVFGSGIWLTGSFCKGFHASVSFVASNDIIRFPSCRIKSIFGDVAHGRARARISCSLSLSLSLSQFMLIKEKTEYNVCILIHKTINGDWII